jgi:hypothetical protein
MMINKTGVTNPIEWYIRTKNRIKLKTDNSIERFPSILAPKTLKKTDNPLNPKNLI